MRLAFPSDSDDEETRYADQSATRWTQNDLMELAASRAWNRPVTDVSAGVVVHGMKLGRFARGFKVWRRRVAGTELAAALVTTAGALDSADLHETVRVEEPAFSTALAESFGRELRV